MHPSLCRRYGARLVLATALLGVSCSGGFDWRELQWPEGGFAVLLPTRPSKETRPVKIGEHTLQLTVLPARVEPFAFGVGYADLPASMSAADRERFVASARASLLANVAAKPNNERTNQLEGFPCREFEAEGVVEKRSLAMAARVCVTDQRYYQLVAIAPKERAAEMDSTLFLGSLKLLKR